MDGILAAGLCVVMVGCAQPEPQRLNAPPRGQLAARPAWADAYPAHNDQGMMADRSIADIHFVPGSADLSGTGVARLERYAELLATSGGTLHYYPSITDDRLIEARLAAAEAFLAQAMPGTKPIQVVAGLPHGRGMQAAEATDGRKVAEKAEPRGTAYKLRVSK